MALLPDFTSDGASEAMLEGLTSLVRKKIRERIMAAIEPDVDAAVDAALQSFKATIETFRDPVHMRDTVRVLIEKKPPKNA